MHQSGRAVIIFCAIIIGGHAQGPPICQDTLPLKGTTKRIPARGFMGCCSVGVNSPELLDSLKTFLQRGGRLFDTAPDYYTEESYGRAVRESGIPREEIWVMASLDNDQWSPGGDTVSWVLEQVDAELAVLGLDYIDVMLLHFGPQQVEYQTYKYMTYDDHLDLWKGLLQARELGKIRFLGVNMHSQLEIENLMKIEAPSVVRTALQPWMPEGQKAYAEWARDQGMAVLINGMFTGGGAGGCAAAKEAGEQHGVTYGQFLIRWLRSQGMGISTDFYHPSIMLEDAPCFDFNITKGDQAILDKFHLKTECEWYENCLAQYLPGCHGPEEGRQYTRFNPVYGVAYCQILNWRDHPVCTHPSDEWELPRGPMPIPAVLMATQSIGVKASMLLILAAISAATVTAGVVRSHFRRRADLSIPLME